MAFECELKKCANEACEQTFRNHGWGTYAASKAGWFHQKDGTSWCPDHLPPWVAEWRARKKKLT